MKKLALYLTLFLLLTPGVRAQDRANFKEIHSRHGWEIIQQQDNPQGPNGTLAERPRLDSTVYQNYDYINKIWSLQSRVDYSYDEMFKFKSSLRSIYELGAWVPDHKSEANFDLFNRISTYIHYRYNPATMNLEKSNYEEFYYDTSGRLKESFTSFWDKDANNWQTNYKLTYTYDLNNKPIIKISQEFDLTLNKWVYDTKTETDFDGSGRMIRVTLYYFDESTNNWLQGHKEEFGYDAQGNIDLLNRYIYSENENKWNDYGSSEFLNDSYGNQLQEEATGIESKTRYNYGYNTDVPLKEVIGPPLDYYPQRFYDKIKNQVTKYTQSVYSNDDMTWYTVVDMAYHYSTHTTGSIKSTISELKAYPNPSDGMVIFPENVKGVLFLYNTSGKQVETFNMTESNQLNIGHLTKGLYIYEIKTDREVFRGKLMLK